MTQTLYQKEHSFERRRNEAKNILAKYPDRLPVICERHEQTGASLPKVDKRKFLVPRDLSVGQFVFVIRKRLQLESTTAIFLMTQSGSLPPSSMQMQAVYEAHLGEDGFLYLCYSAENAFG